MSDPIDWKKVVVIWRASGRSPGTIQVYSYWARRYVRYCIAEGLVPFEYLTHAHVAKYRGTEISGARRRRQGHALDTRVASHSLRALWCALNALGYQLPPWRESKPAPKLSPSVRSFVQYRLRQHGVAASTAPQDAHVATLFTGWLRERGRPISRMRVVDVEDFVTECAKERAPKTVAGMCSTLRAFLRYLHATGRAAADLGPAVLGPRIRWADRPPRALPWTDVRRLLRAIDVRTALGRRDYAMFLMMATYGMGAGEVLGLRLEDIDWRKRTLHVHRPKTGTRTVLPLLAPVARAVASYLRRGRPSHARDRTVFVNHRMPHAALSSSSAIRHRLAEHAAAAGIAASFLGSHVFRHTHATRQIESGASPKIVGDILGHRHPESTSAYVRGAVLKLRAVPLPVPR